jgi:hypothetical protein
MSPVENPEPDTLTVDPAEVEMRLSAIEGLLTIAVVVWLVATSVEVTLVCIEVEVVPLVCEEMVKSNLMFTPVSDTVLVTGPKPGPEAVTVIVPDVPIGIA